MTNQTAKVVQYRAFGGPEVLELVDVTIPAPAHGEMVVEARAIGVNPLDWKIRRALRPTGPITEPRRPGADAAGVVSAVGEGVPDWAVGDEVIVHGAVGAYASHIVVAPSQVTVKPPGLDWERAAALGIPVGTAYQAIVSLGVEKDSTLLIHAGSGTVGQAAIQFARRRGARILATASPVNHGRIRALGAEPVAYGAGLLERIRASAPNGVDRVLDIAGSDEAIEVSLALVDDPQRIATLVIGARAADLGIRAWGGGSPVPLTAGELRLRKEGVEVAASMLAKGDFEVTIGNVYRLEDAADAHRESESGHPSGKIILRP